MSSAVYATDYTSNTSIPNDVFNPENYDLTDTYHTIRNDFLGHSNTFRRPKDESEKLLIEIYRECSENNWDGYGAFPIKIEALFEALRFINNLPTTISMPSDISADSHGNITMEWRKRRGLIFNISFNGNNELIYAGIMGTDKPRGLLYLGTRIPSNIIDHIESINI